MLLNTLRLQNYKQYGALDIEFREGLVGIIGRNGAGKSTIFEAVLYCLYGKDEINNKELIRSAFAEIKSQVLLELDFSIGEIRYRVRRELRGKKLETVPATLYKNEQQIAQGATAVNDEIVRLLKLDRDAFKRSVFSGQRELTELSDTKGEKRTIMVRKMLGLENLDDIQAEVNKDKSILRNQIAGQEQLLLDPDARQQILDQIEDHGQLLNADKLQLRAEQEQQSALEKQFQEQKIRFETETHKLSRHNDIRRLLAQLTERSKGFSDQQIQLRDHLKRQEARQVALEKEGADFVPFENNQKALRLLEDDRQKFIHFEAITGKIKALQEPLQQSRERLHALDEQIQKLPALEQALAERRQEIERLSKEREAKVQQLEELNKAVSTLEERTRDRRAKIETLQAIGEDGACPTCFQPLRSA
ncbi:MAG: AAA family ATPase, partial [Saprospiraceae bacterium]